MFNCKFCESKFNCLEGYLEHQRQNHLNLQTSRKFHCRYKNCPSVFSKIQSLKTHVIRYHTSISKRTVVIVEGNCNENGQFVCTVNLCKKQFDNVAELLKHLKHHMKNNEVITCPFSDCKSKYRNVQSFTCHTSRKHRQKTVQSETIPLSDSNTSMSQSENRHESELHISYTESVNRDEQMNVEVANELRTNDENIKKNFLSNVAQFFFKLESKLLIPVSTIKHVFEEIHNMQYLMENMLQISLREKLCFEQMTSEFDVDEAIRKAFAECSFSQIVSCINSDYKRKEFYKENFQYVEPELIVIDHTKNTFFHYVPILKSLEFLCNDKFFKNDLFFDYKSSGDEDILCDFTDGSEFQKNHFHRENSKTLKVILSQDAFEVVNPLGSAKGKYKMLGIYMSLGNLPDHLRCHVKNIKLVGLCKEKNFKHDKVFGKIVEDLKIVEEKGIKCNGEFIKGSLVFIAGDNLGSHALGGFVENFSTSSHFCRYCLVTLKKFHQEKSELKVYMPRTVASYKNALKNISKDGHYKGVKFNSVFNQLQHFHVCSPGLPPCLAHDLLEGVAAYDVHLIMKQLIKKKWFTLIELNERINSFRYSSKNLRDKPCIISATSKKITGGAAQILSFLRLLPLIMADKIKDPNDESWLTLLALIEITEIIISPAISRKILPYLSRLIQDYLGMRKKISQLKLRPKHHYLTHYPELILKYGPLTKVWTMRFESKHSYFKNVMRHLHNFLNVTRSLATKHELYQTLLRLGDDLRSDNECYEITDFVFHHYNEEIVACVKSINSDYLSQCSKVTLRGTMYKKGCVLHVKQDGYQYNVVLGKVVTFLKDGTNIIHVLLEIMENEFILQLRVYKIGKKMSYNCLPLDQLSHSKPMHIYTVNNMLCVRPDHGWVTCID